MPDQEALAQPRAGGDDADSAMLHRLTLVERHQVGALQVGHGRGQGLQVIEQVDAEAEALGQGVGLDDPGQIRYLRPPADHRPGHAKAAGRNVVGALSQELLDDQFQRVVLLAREGAFQNGVTVNERVALLGVEERQNSFGSTDVACE